MAAKFVRSGAAGAGTGADWSNAFTTLALCIAGGLAAGDTVWIADDHNESTVGTVTWTFPGTLANPNFIYCVDHTVASPGTGDLKTTAVVTVSNNTVVAGSLYVYGITFVSLTGSYGPPLQWQVYDSCVFSVTHNISTTLLIGNGTRAKTTLYNTSLKFASAAAQVVLGSSVTWKASAALAAGSTVPTVLINPTSNDGLIVIEGVDFASFGSGKTLVGQASNNGATFFFKDCKLAASVTISATPIMPTGAVFVARSDSGATNYRAEKYAYQGTETTETTIVRSGGASDGVTAQSRKIVTTANAKWVAPFEALPIIIWNDTVGVPKTVTIEGVASALPNNDDIWVEAEYLGSTLTPQGSFANNTKANNLATGTALTVSSATWASSPGHPFQLTVTFTPQMKGPITLYVKVGKASFTVYVDPKISIV